MNGNERTLQSTASARHGVLRASDVCHLRVLLAILVFAFILSDSLTHAGQKGPHRSTGLDANQLASEVVQNELNAQSDDKSLWKYRELRQHDGKTELLQVVETRDGDIHRLLSVNDKPLPLEQRRSEDLRIKNLLDDPAKFRDVQKSRNEDAQKERELLGQLSAAFCYQYAGQEGNLSKLQFSPNPNFHPSGREGQVFHHTSGFMLVDQHEKRLAGLNGRLTSEVKFGFGLLGHLDRGGTFSVNQNNVGSGHWAMTSLNVEMNGKVLFFKTIDVREKETDFDFEMLPGGTTLRKAAELLEKYPVGQNASRE